MIIPPFLNEGDTVGILSTARKIEEKQIEKAIEIIKSWGFKVKLGRSIGAEHHQFAGTDELRANDLQDMLDDTDIKAIFCAKGGYGTIRIIDLIDFSTFLNNPKWVLGYSDVTVLHATLNNKLNCCSIHSLMPGGFQPYEKNDLTISSIEDALKGSLKTYSFEKHEFNKEGKVTGRLIGGNLSILYNLVGSESDFMPEDKILFFEDIDEYLYHIDRMLWNLKRAGKFEALKGLLVGGMTDMNDHAIPFGWQAEESVRDHFDAYNFPLAYNFPSGHHSQNYAQYLGMKVEIEVNRENSKLIFLNE